MLTLAAVAAACSGESTPGAMNGSVAGSAGMNVSAAGASAGKSGAATTGLGGEVGVLAGGGGNGSAGTPSAAGSSNSGAAGSASGSVGASGSSAAGTAGADTGGAGSAGNGGLGSTGKLEAYIVITSKGTPTPGDLLMIGRIKAHGFETVTPVTDALVSAESVADANLVVISSSAESGPLKSKLRTVPLPVLVIEDAEFSLMGMAASGDHDANISQVTVAAGASALVGTASGTVTFSSKPGDLGWAAGTNASSVLLGATMPGNPAHAAIFGYPKGAQMPGLVAPGRRAGFAIRETLAANLNADGVKLFDAILEWVMQ